MKSIRVETLPPPSALNCSQISTCRCENHIQIGGLFGKVEVLVPRHHPFQDMREIVRETFELREGLDSLAEGQNVPKIGIWVSSLQTETDVPSELHVVGDDQVGVGQVAYQKVLLAQKLRNPLCEVIGRTALLGGLSGLLLDILGSEMLGDRVHQISGDSLKLPHSGLVLDILAEQIDSIGLISNVEGDGAGFGHNEVPIDEVSSWAAGHPPQRPPPS